MSECLLVMGAGSIGGFIGGRLAAAGAEVHFVGRPRVLQPLRTQGLTLSDIERPGPAQHLEPARLHLHERVPANLRPALALLCVKSAATADAAAALAAALPAGTPVLSLQNGISNPATAQRAAPALQLIPGMVPFNVAELAPGRLHRGTSGQLATQRAAVLERLAPLFERAGLPLALHDDLLPVQWGKLLLNLNNPVNALSGLPLRRQLLQRPWRRITAALQQEALTVLHAAGIRPAQVAAVPPRWMPRVLALPTPLFRAVAARSLKIDEQARSSMADDLALGRVPEIDALCGEVVRLAGANGVRAPLNQRMCELMLEAPRRERDAAAVLRALRRR